MKFIKKFERFSPAPAPAPAPTKPAPSPSPSPRPTPPTKPVPPTKPTPRNPIETPSTNPGPLAASENDVVKRLEKELKKKDMTLAEFVKKSKKTKK